MKSRTFYYEPPIDTPDCKMIHAYVTPQSSPSHTSEKPCYTGAFTVSVQEGDSIGMGISVWGNELAEIEALKEGEEWVSTEPKRPGMFQMEEEEKVGARREKDFMVLAEPLGTYWYNRTTFGIKDFEAILAAAKETGW